jgi:hypothetical protein
MERNRLNCGHIQRYYIVLIVWSAVDKFDPSNPLYPGQKRLDGVLRDRQCLRDSGIYDAV